MTNGEQAGDLSRNLEVRLLGRPLIRWINEPLNIERRQVRELLYRLAESGEPIPRSALCFLFWPDSPEKVARRNLSRLISYLKRTLPNLRLVLVEGEYVGLENTAVWSDVIEFTRLCQADGPPSSSLRKQEEAINLYRGRFLDGLNLEDQIEYENWLMDRRRSYERLYLETLDKLINTHTSNGDLVSAIRYAQYYLAVDELAEDIHRRLIELYGATGQREQAIRQLEHCTRILEEELGVQPLPETLEAITAVVEGSQAERLANFEHSWSIIPSLDLPLIGRNVAWKALQNAFQSQPDGGFILISGEAGIGKSRILQEFATSRRQLVLTGNSHASTMTLPYQPLLQALRITISQPQLWEGIKPIWLAELSLMLPELREQYPDLPEPLVVPPKLAKSRTLEAFTQVFLGISNNGAPLILCLDDLHWADEETQGWLMYAGRYLPQSRLCILGTYRTEEAQAVSRLRESLTRQGVLSEVFLDELSLSAVQQILTYLQDQISWQEDFPRRLHETTGGNTLFLLETIRILLELGIDDIRAVDQFPLPETVQSSILSRTKRLSPLAFQILETTAVLSPNLTFDLVCLTTNRRESEVARGLDELTMQQLLICSGEGCQFRHDLIRTAIYQNLDAWRRRLLHRRSAEAMIDVYRSNPSQVQGQIALHFDLAAEVEQAAVYYKKAATEAQKAHAHESALVYWQRVLELATSLKWEDKELAFCYEQLGNNLAYSGRLPEARRVFGNAIGIIPPADNLWRASIQGKIANNYQIHDSYDEAVSDFNLALAMLGSKTAENDPAWWRVWFQIQLDFWERLYFNARDQEMAELASKLKALIKQYGSDADRYAYHFHEGQRRYRLTRFAPSEWPVEAMRLSLHYARKVGDPMMIAQAQFGLGFGLLWNKEWEVALAELRSTLALVERIAHRPLQTQCLAYITLLQRLRGNFQGVQATIEETQESAQLQGAQVYIGHTLANRAWLHFREGLLVEAKENAFSALTNWPPTYPLHWMAHTIILAISLSENDLKQAVDSARVILRPVETRHSKELTALLEQAVLSWDDGEYEKTKIQLQKAVIQARQLNYI